MRSKGDGGLFRAEGFRHALLGNGIATQVSAELEANIRGVVVARYNRGAPLRKPVTCSALPRTPPVRILHVYVYPPRDGIIVTCSGEPRTRSSSTNDRLSSGGGGDDTFLLFSRFSRTKSWADRNLPSSPSISFLFLIPFAQDIRSIESREKSGWTRFSGAENYVCGASSRLVCRENKPSRRGKLEKLVSSGSGASDIQRTRAWDAERERVWVEAGLQNPGG